MNDPAMLITPSPLRIPGLTCIGQPLISQPFAIRPTLKPIAEHCVHVLHTASMSQTNNHTLSTGVAPANPVNPSIADAKLGSIFTLTIDGERRTYISTGLGPSSAQKRPTSISALRIAIVDDDDAIAFASAHKKAAMPMTAEDDVTPAVTVPGGYPESKVLVYKGESIPQGKRGFVMLDQGVVFEFEDGSNDGQTVH